MKYRNVWIENIHYWVEDHFYASLIIGIILILPIPIIILFVDDSESRSGRTVIIAVSAVVITLYGIYLIYWSLLSCAKQNHKLKNRAAEFIFGLLLLAPASLLIIFTFPYYEGWMKNMEGSALRIGPIIIPGIFLVLLVPGIGIAVGIVGISRMIRSCLSKKQRLK